MVLLQTKSHQMALLQSKPRVQVLRLNLCRSALRHCLHASVLKKERLSHAVRHCLHASVLHAQTSPNSACARGFLLLFA